MLTALNIVFGSLYLDEVVLDPMTVVSVLAAAELLQLDGLIEKCCEVMNSTINAEVRMMQINNLTIAYIDLIVLNMSFVFTLSIDRNQIL